ncbi:septum site-determining protein minD, partial [Kineococcus sp. T13]|uniref:septum site-determining protein Ssd n=1 Tax=Kineococcus vitellinus TaxID=2696565 RepID=UPI00141285A6
PDHRAPAGSALLITADDDLAEAVARLAAAAGCPLRRGPLEQPAEGAAGPPGPVAAPGLVLVDADVPAAAVAGLGEGGRLVVVGTAPAPDAWWRSASALGAEHAVLLPQAQDWLLEALADTAAGAAAAGCVGVVGGCGGAGASVLAAALAQALAETTGDCLLLDADPRSGGADLLLGADALPGLRWGDLAAVSGRLRPDVLRSTVRAGAGLHVLAADRRVPGTPGPAALAAVADAARRTFAATVLDLPRAGLPQLHGRLGGCEEVLVVVPASTRAAAAACAVVDELRSGPSAPPVRLVVRDLGAGTDAEDVADAVGAPLAGVLRPDRDLEAALERGEGPPTGRRSPLRSFALACAGDWAATWSAAAAAPAPW